MNKQTDNFCVKPNTVVEFNPEHWFQIEELSEWTKLIMKENDCMIVYGY